MVDSYPPIYVLLHKEGRVMNGQTITARLNLRDKFLKILKSASMERPKLSTWVKTNDEHVPEWVLFERSKMVEAVNEERRNRGLSILPVEAIRRQERAAVGHSDYASKYALYCAQLALGET